MCDSCHQGYHNECVLWMGSEDKCDGMLDANAVWRCRVCVTRNLLGSLVDDKGEEKLLIRWYRPVGALEDGQHGSCDGTHGHGRCTVGQCYPASFALGGVTT